METVLKIASLLLKKYATSLTNNTCNDTEKDIIGLIEKIGLHNFDRMAEDWNGGEIYNAYDTDWIVVNTIANELEKLSSIKVVGETPKLDWMKNTGNNPNYALSDKILGQVNKEGEWFDNQKWTYNSEWLSGYFKGFSSGARWMHAEFCEELTVPTPPLQVEITDPDEHFHNLMDFATTIANIFYYAGRDKKYMDIPNDVAEMFTNGDFKEHISKLKVSQPKVEITKEEILERARMNVANKRGFNKWEDISNIYDLSDMDDLYEKELIPEFLRLSGVDK